MPHTGTLWMFDDHLKCFPAWHSTAEKTYEPASLLLGCIMQAVQADALSLMNNLLRSAGYAMTSGRQHLDFHAVPEEVSEESGSAHEHLLTPPALNVSKSWLTFVFASCRNFLLHCS